MGALSDPDALGLALHDLPIETPGTPATPRSPADCAEHLPTSRTRTPCAQPSCLKQFRFWECFVNLVKFGCVPASWGLEHGINILRGSWADQSSGVTGHGLGFGSLCFWVGLRVGP